MTERPDADAQPLLLRAGICSRGHTIRSADDIAELPAWHWDIGRHDNVTHRCWLCWLDAADEAHNPKMDPVLLAEWRRRQTRIAQERLTG